MAKKPKYLVNEKRRDLFIRAWSEGRGRDSIIVVQIWESGKPEGDADGDWGMPSLLRVEGAITQAIFNQAKKR